jgi:hypothetical protein
MVGCGCEVLGKLTFTIVVFSSFLSDDLIGDDGGLLGCDVEEV